jgi:hypothetical protein
MTDYQKDCHVTYQHDDEYYGKLHLDFTDVRTEDRLDGWHPYLTQFDKKTTHFTLSGQVPWTPPLGPGDYIPDWDRHMKPYKWGSYSDGGTTPLGK